MKPNLVPGIRRAGLFIALYSLLFGCMDLDVGDANKAKQEKLSLDALANLPKAVRDSTRLSESLVATSTSRASELSSVAALATTLVNFAPQATVTAESTYPNYSVARINDGDRTTTVGPAYSWANNFPAGGKLPESVFLKFSALKTIERIDIYTSSGYALQNYTIQYRTTPTGAWINLVIITGNTAVSRTHTFSSIAVREVQIICQLGPSNQTIYGRLNEVEIYGATEPTLPSISMQGGMLVFSSTDAVTQAMDYLDFKYEQYTDAFVEQYASLTSDQLADVEESTGFNDEQPFIEFEGQYGITSLRSVITAAEDNWLATTAGNDSAGTDPDDTYVDEVELRALLNSNAQLKVGSTYYTFMSDGSYYTSTGTPVTVQAAQAMKASNVLQPNVTYVNPNLVAPSCKAVAKNKGFIPSSDGSWRLKWKVKASDGPFEGPGRAKAITRSYKKKNGHWKKRSSPIGAQVYGTIVAWDCSGGTSIDSGWKSKRARKVKVKVSYSGGKVRSGDISSIHYQEKVGYVTKTLTF